MIFRQLTGTSLGDLIEIEGINTVFRGSHTGERPLILGAAKASIGHTEVTAGLVGIVKAMKQLSEGKVTGMNSLANGTLNSEIDTALVPLQIPSFSTDLRKRDSHVPYRALVVCVLCCH
jgi:acyl transferase domain-containing protein